MNKLLTVMALAIGTIFFVGCTTTPITTPDTITTGTLATGNVDTGALQSCLPTTTPWIKIVSPNGGESYQAGQQITVTWESCNALAPIYLSLKKQDPTKLLESNNDNGSLYPWDLTTSGTPNDGMEQITLPLSSDTNLLSGQHYYVTVTSSEDTTIQPNVPVWATDNSDDLFTIQ